MYICVFVCTRANTYNYVYVSFRIPASCCPPLCAGALWPMPAWVWRDVRSVLFFLFLFQAHSVVARWTLCSGPLHIQRTRMRLVNA